MIVLDASAACEWLAETDVGHKIAHRLQTEPSLHAPHLLDVEVLSALRKHCRLGVMTEERARRSFLALELVPLRRYPHGPLRERIWELRHNFTIYDACYVALTEILDATLLTCDEALRHAPLHRGRVEVIT